MKGEWTVRASDVVYEDEWIIVVNKAYGVPSQPTRDPDRDNVFDAVTRYHFSVSIPCYCLRISTLSVRHLIPAYHICLRRIILGHLFDTQAP